jgi:hypothetical protein
MSKERDIQILEYKIADLETKIDNFIANKISQKKIDRLEMLKLKYEQQLEDIELA